MQNAIGDGRRDVVDRVALRTLSKRGAEYAAEIRRLLDAALEVIGTCGTASRPRVDGLAPIRPGFSPPFVR